MNDKAKIDERCATASGAYRCMHGRGHDGPCEAQAREYATSARRVSLAAQPLPEPRPAGEK